MSMRKMSKHAVDLSATERLIRISQRGWAEGRNLSFDRSDRLADLEDNLFQPMNLETRSEFEAGDGGELGTTDAPGSMHSLISSSALCCNVFDAWRNRPLGDLGVALGIDRSYEVHRFESKHPTGLLGKAPNLDLELHAPGMRPVAIESKFVETYRVARNAFKRSYFSNKALWTGLESWRRVAVAIDQGDLTFVTLNAAQLIKHALGLSRRYGSKGFVLLYLWYRLPGPAGDAHQAELDRFHEEVGDTVAFRTASYPEVFSRAISGSPRWIDYMRHRYQPAPANSPG
jgi:hypothetical protein